MPPPQLTPQQQFLLDLKQNQPETFGALDYKKQTEAYARAEFQKRDQQAILDKLNANATPGSPFQQQMWEQAKQQVIKDHAAMNTGVPLTANAIADQAGKAFQRNYEPWGAQTRATIQSSQTLVEGFVKEQIKMAEDTRPQIADHPADRDELQGYKQGLNTVDIMTNRYQTLLKNHPELGNNPGALLANAESYKNDPDVRAYLQTLPLIQSFYAKHIGSDTGRLSNQEQDMAKGAIPQPGDSLQTVLQKADYLKQMIASDYQSKLAGLQTSKMKTGDYTDVNPNDPSTYAPKPRSDAGNNPAGDFSPGTHPAADPTQNPNVGQPTSQATPTPTPLSDYAQRSLNYMNQFSTGNAKATVQQQQQTAQTAQQQQQAVVQQQQAAVQQQAAQTQQQAQQDGATAARQSYSD